MDDARGKVDSVHGHAAGKVEGGGVEQKGGDASKFPAWSPTRCVIDWEARPEPWCRIGPEFKKQVIGITKGLPPHAR